MNTPQLKHEPSELEIINGFAISLLKQNTLDDLLWSMAGNIGELLAFEDCVIYLRENDLLVQVAAYGVKSPARGEIQNRIKITVGEGIVGVAAQQAKPEYVANLSIDSRYIRDQFGGLSELAVPLIYEDSVIGVIDSESSSINGFSPNDIDMLVSIANIAAPRIASAISQRDKEAAEAGLRKAKQEAEDSNKAKSEFLTRMSHELKTPLNAILGFANLIKLDAGSEGDSRVDNILLAGQHLLSLINELLDIVRIEQNFISMNIKPTPVCSVVQDCVAMIEPELDKRQITVDIDIPVLAVLADEQRLRQVIFNLLSNACKYNVRGGSIKVTAQLRGKDKVKIQLQDSGIGIAAEDFEKIFAPFTRFGAREDEVEGHGVGMMICRQLVELMGGQISVISELGKGTSVSFTLPLAAMPL